MADKDAGNDYRPNYSQYPWKHINSLSQIFNDSPVLMSLELTTLAIYLALVLHAIQHSKLAVLASATVAGAVNELVFLNVPLVNNFWHAQAWLMLGPRLPAWQPALYAFFLYTASQSTERLRLSGWPLISRAAAAGLLGFLILFPLDAVCVKFVAYTWHDSDPLLADRLLGVATGNGMFGVAFSACFSALIATAGPVAAAALSTPAMVMLTLPITQYLGGGVPNGAGLAALVVAAASAVFASVAFSQPQPALAKRPQSLSPPQDWTPVLAAVAHFAVLLMVSACADPAAQKSVGFHQPLSDHGAPCRDDTELSASGRSRRVFLCPVGGPTYREFVPGCDASSWLDQHWYAVCGVPFGRSGGSRTQFLTSLAGIAAIGVAGLIGCQVA